MSEIFLSIAIRSRNRDPSRPPVIPEQRAIALSVRRIIHIPERLRNRCRGGRYFTRHDRNEKRVKLVVEDLKAAIAPLTVEVGYVLRLRRRGGYAPAISAPTQRLPSSCCIAKETGRYWGLLAGVAVTHNYTRIRYYCTQPCIPPNSRLACSYDP